MTDQLEWDSTDQTPLLPKKKPKRKMEIARRRATVDAKGTRRLPAEMGRTPRSSPSKPAPTTQQTLTQTQTSLEPVGEPSMTAFVGRIFTGSMGIALRWTLLSLSWLLSHLIALAWLALVVAVLGYYLWSLVPSLRWPAVPICMPSIGSPLLAMYCSTVGVGCQSDKPNLAILARTTASQAHQAHDIFQSLVSLGDSKTHTLAFTEIWELAVAVQVSSDLPMKDHFGAALKELGDATRDVSDSLVDINSVSLATFSWTLHEFNVIERTIRHIHERTGNYNSEDVTRQLERLLDNLSSNLDDVLGKVEHAQRAASRASDIGKHVLVRFTQEERRLRELKEDTPLWRFLLEKNTFKGRQLRRDIDLTSLSIENVKAASSNLERARLFLRKYRNNLAYFKASVMGFHGSDLALQPEHEVEALGDIMAQFSDAVRKAKQLPAEPA